PPSFRLTRMGRHQLQDTAHHLETEPLINWSFHPRYPAEWRAEDAPADQPRRADRSIQEVDGRGCAAPDRQNHIHELVPMFALSPAREGLLGLVRAYPLR